MYEAVASIYFVHKSVLLDYGSRLRNGTFPLLHTSFVDVDFWQAENRRSAMTDCKDLAWDD